jgi:cytochrome c-type biogenesis protein CcmF
MMILLTFSASFALIVNGEIAIKIIRGNLRMLGAYVAHIGIALFILGVIGSAVYSKEVDLDLVRNEPKEAFGYEMVFTGWNPIENNSKYSFNITLKQGEKNYKVSPVMYISDFNNGLMREPAILTTFTKDIYVSPLGYEEGTHNHDTEINLKENESTEFQGTQIVFKEFDITPETMAAMQSGKDFKLGAKLTASSKDVLKEFELFMVNTGGKIEYTSETIKELNLKVILKSLSADKISIQLSSADGSNQVTAESGKEVLTVTASVKPFINFVWIGVAVMVLGFFVSVTRRLKESLIR